MKCVLGNCYSIRSRGIRLQPVSPHPLLHQKGKQKPVLAMAVGGLVLMGAGGSQVPTEASYLNVGQETYETDQVGKVTIKRRNQ